MQSIHVHQLSLKDLERKILPALNVHCSNRAFVQLHIFGQDAFTISKAVDEQEVVLQIGYPVARIVEYNEDYEHLSWVNAGCVCRCDSPGKDDFMERLCFFRTKYSDTFNHMEAEGAQNFLCSCLDQVHANLEDVEVLEDSEQVEADDDGDETEMEEDLEDPDFGLELEDFGC